MLTYRQQLVIDIKQSLLSRIKSLVSTIRTPLTSIQKYASHSPLRMPTDRQIAENHVSDSKDGHLLTCT